MNFVAIDVTLLVLFVIGTIIFLYKRKKNLERQGILFLYKTQLGIKFIDTTVKKFHKVLKPLQYLVVTCGYALMLGMLWLTAQTTYLYLATPISKIFKAPPIAPLIPYFPKLFGLESYFPPLYFVYFIIVLAIVAIVHEFSHGIFARLNNFKIKSTGFAFLGPILGAFVEPDEKKMAKAKKFPQLAVLAAGTFANVVTALVFVIILMLFFSASFAPYGVKFNTYSVAPVAVNDIKILGNSTLDAGVVLIESNHTKYFTYQSAIQAAKQSHAQVIGAYEDSPATEAKLKGAIIEINNQPTRTLEELQNTLKNSKPNENVTIKTAILYPGQDVISEIRTYHIQLSEKNGKAFLGIGFYTNQYNGISGALYKETIAKVKQPLVLYKSPMGDFAWFIYYLLWWIVVINLLVALFNMLPLGILDGGRFFYLTVWGITKNEKAARIAFKIMLWLLIAVLAILMTKWVFSLG